MQDGPVTTRALAPALWPAVEALFGANGACAGCWCMYWRLARGERMEAVKGAEAKRRFRALVEAGEAQGLLAFAGDAPVGWLAFGPRRSFAALDRAPSLACDDADEVWSLPCFFIRRDWRGRGVATALLRDALPVMAAHGARIAEGYPAKPAPGGATRMPAAFAWTGTLPLFLKAGFNVVAERERGKQRVRRAL
jgi:GNAT superfamily N-acetyltransferase